MLRSVTLLAALLCVAGGPAAAQDVIQSDIAARLDRIEAENRQLQNQLRWMQEHPTRPAGIAAGPVDMMVADNREAIPDPAPAMTVEQVRGEIRQSAWSKGDLKVVPYGILWGNSIYSTERTTPGSYTLYVQSPSVQGESEFIVDARNTRLGTDVAGPRVCWLNDAQIGGKVEFDFQSSLVVPENKSTVLLRHAYCELKNDEFRFLFGQTWDVVSPLMPGMLMYSVGWDGGNIGYRRAQVRLEKYYAVSDASLLTLQGSINQNVFTDVITNVAGEASGWPIIEARAAWTLGRRTGPDARPVTFGVSGHIGEEEYDVTGGPNNDHARTWSLNGDLRIPINERLGVQTEVFTGSNLGAFLGGIGQGIDRATLEPIRSRGGWIEMWYDWTPFLHSHLGYSLDDPIDADLHAVGERRYNQFYFGNVSYDVTKQFLLGLEVSSWRTLYLGQLPGNSVRCEFVAKYAF